MSAILIDEDLQKFAQAIEDLKAAPSDELLRQKIHETSRFVYISAIDAATMYEGVIEGFGLVENKTRAQLIEEEFEEALSLMSPVRDDYLLAVKSRWEELQLAIDPALFEHTAQ